MPIDALGKFVQFFPQPSPLLGAQVALSLNLCAERITSGLTSGLTPGPCSRRRVATDGVNREAQKFWVKAVEECRIHCNINAEGAHLPHVLLVGQAQYALQF